MLRFLLPIFLVYFSTLWGEAPSISVAPQRSAFPLSEGPVLVGPLLSPSAQTLPAGHIDFATYLFAFHTTGFYDNHWHLKRLPTTFETINFLFLVQVGLNSFMDFLILPQFLYQSYRDADSFGFGDLYWQLGIQLIREEDSRGIPGLRFFFGQILPTGVYDRLSVSKYKTDAFGEGSLDVLLGLVTSYIWTFKNADARSKYLAARMAVGYQISSRVSVHGLNFYGGDLATSGVVQPGDLIQVLIGTEYTLTRYWALALDIDYEMQFPTRFEGCTRVPVGIDRFSCQFSLAPAIEYNYSNNIGVIAGVWFTVFGRNTDAFVSGVLAINFYL